MISSAAVANPGDRRTAHFRAHERRAVRLDALLFRPGSAEPASAKLYDLGLGGAGVVSPSPLRAEERLTVTLLSPTLLDPLVALARVAWVSPSDGVPEAYTAGLAFEALERDALLTLFQLISALPA